MVSTLTNPHHLQKNLLQVAHQDLHKAMDILRRPSGAARAQDAAVHKCRKHLKKLRAIAKLFSGGTGKTRIRRDNLTLRDAGRPLSALRDATALINTLRTLRRNSPTRIDRRESAAVERALENRRAEIRRRDLGAFPTFPATLNLLEFMTDRMDAWRLPHHSRRHLQKQWRRTFQRACKAGRLALETATDADLHEWRKRAKDLRYQADLLLPLWPQTFEPLVPAVKKLTDLLGEDHDLAVLRDFLDFDWPVGKEVQGEGTIRPAIDRRRSTLQATAARLGKRLFSRPPSSKHTVP